MREFLELILDAQLYDSGNLNVRDAKLCFIRARMRACQESTTSRAYDRARTLSFIDFLEALGRAADVMKEPWQQQPSTLDMPVPASDISSASGQPLVAACDSKPLDVHLEALINTLTQRLQDKFQASDATVLIQRLKAGRGKRFALGHTGMV